jgi:hypothetical protein
MATLWEKMCISENEYEELIASVGYKIDTVGCDHSYEETMKFLERRYKLSQPQMVATRRILMDSGISCDCDLAKQRK